MLDFTLQQKIITTARQAALAASQINLAALWQRLSRITAITEPPQWYGALPTAEPVDFKRAVLPAATVPVAGVDGSQILPEATDPAPWVYLQAVTYRMGTSPQLVSSFFDLKALSAQKDASCRAYQSLLRLNGDLAQFVLEQRTLLELQAGLDAGGDALTLLDNPLIPWGALNRTQGTRALADYLSLFCQLRGRLLAGVISVPRSKLLSNLLALAEGTQEEQALWAWQGISDAQWMGYHLQPGERSARFRHGSWRNQAFLASHAAIYFFFLKVNDYETLRVDVPEWVAVDDAAVDAIHAAILQDSLALGYPYVLSCAHHHACISGDVAETLRSLGSRTWLEHHGCWYLPAKQRMKMAAYQH